MIHPGLFVSGGRSDPGASEMLNHELVGEDGSEYKQMRTTTSEEEGWAAAPFKDALELGGVLWLTRLEPHDRHF